ncbi:hypothetical protein Tco_0802200 [Tanacetum coccineum]|uniref:Uncharacterized protein n=1 Tax=Tanacetum coccineum TaxID=301880 RepID=A0ABQ5A2C2_9ASTR
MGFVSYNDVPPPHTGLFTPPKLDVSNSGLEEFQQPEFEGYGPKTSKCVSEDVSNEFRESPDAQLVKELVSNDKLEKKTFSYCHKVLGKSKKLNKSELPTARSLSTSNLSASIISCVLSYDLIKAMVASSSFCLASISSSSNSASSSTIISLPLSLACGSCDACRSCDSCEVDDVVLNSLGS